MKISLYLRLCHVQSFAHPLLYQWKCILGIRCNATQCIISFASVLCGNKKNLRKICVHQNGSKYNVLFNLLFKKWHVNMYVLQNGRKLNSWCWNWLQGHPKTVFYNVHFCPDFLKPIDYRFTRILSCVRLCTLEWLYVQLYTCTWKGLL